MPSCPSRAAGSQSDKGGSLRFHLVSLPHTQTTAEFVSCAYTQKVVKFARMMKARGHEIILYSGEENEAPCDEHHVIVKNHEQRKWFGKKNLQAMYPITWDPKDDHWQVTNKRVIRLINKGIKEGRYDKTDMVCVIAGSCNQQIDNGIPNICPEYGVGYTGVFSVARAFESSSHMHTVWKLTGTEDGRFYDTVIPNYFDPAEFTNLAPKREDHLLYVGRVILRKGVHIAAQVAERSGRKLLVAGQGVVKHEPGFIESDEIELRSPNIEYIGTLGVEERAYEMSRAHAVLVPTTYIEPFGGVAVEAMMSGTPAITTDWGAFRETVVSGLSGYRPSLIREWVQAVEDAGDLDSSHIRAYANSRFGLEAVAPMFEDWFERIETLWGEGWYSS